MRTIFFIIRKEFKQIFRNKGMLPIIFVMPILQLLILANAATYDIKNLRIFFVDNDMTSMSTQLRNKFDATPYFIDAGFSFNPKDASKALDEGKADLFLEIPSGFEKKIIKNNTSDTPALFLTMNAIDGTKAGLGMFYANSIISDFNLNLIKEIKVIPDNQILVQTKSINIDYSNWYNPELNYKTFMLPGILVLLVTMIAAFLSAMNVVREKEVGTIDQINVTPIKKYQFIIGKLTPLWLLAMFELAFGLSISLLIYDIPFLGSIVVLFSFAAIYILACVGLGLLISTISDNQQQAMFLTWFLMVVFILLGGLFTAIESMPLWVQYLTYGNPVRYFIEVVRLVMLKGSGFSDISRQFIIISFFAVSINLLAVMRYKKVSS
jgi:ABC-2 type transport system permease protein